MKNDHDQRPLFFMGLGLGLALSAFCFQAGSVEHAAEPVGIIPLDCLQASPDLSLYKVHADGTGTGI